METQPPNRIHSLGPRVPVYLEPRAPSTVVGMKMPSRIAPRDSTETCTSENAHLCEKPIQQKDLAVPIALGVIIPVVAIIGVLLWLHRRNVKKMRREDQDPNNELDFGLGDKPSAVNSLRKSIFGEKSAHKHQLSMDLDMSTPYLLPPQLHGSRESLHSLAHSVQTPEDPYRPVGQFNGSEVGSLRSVHRGPGGGGDQSSLYTTSTRSGVARDMMSPTRSNFPRPPPATADPYQHRPPPASSQVPQSPHSPLSSSQVNADPFRAQPKDYAQSMPYPDNPAAPAHSNRAELPVLDMPTTSDTVLFPNDAHDSQNHPSSNFPTPMSATIETAHSTDHPASHPEPQQAQMGHVRHYSMDEYTTPAQAPYPQRGASHDQSEPAMMPAMGRESYYGDDNAHHNYLQDDASLEEDDRRGRRATRFLDDEAQRGSQFLAAPPVEERRLSVGLRPLPPDEVMDTEDPEHRANRIRSFYKEYFEVDPSQSHPPLPTSNPVDPSQREGPRHAPAQDESGYYEDYDGNYLENTYIDPASNSFVMPYAQPVHRRAMTPPPRGPRMRGPQPPRNFHGSMGGMSMPGGRGPFRPGSATSSRFGPRPGSSASARMGPRGRPLPPPADLTTLPNPAKLGDDTFALLSANDFAPPDTYKDRVAGRSQSPMPEKRAYHLGVPIHSPLASSYDELAAIPSPHLLRKSSTFTGLDFALPKRFKDDGDLMSDAGSIRSSRSNKSGISAMNQAAIRSGAGRVSRLPGDTVFTTDQIADQLKPNWGMRN